MTKLQRIFCGDIELKLNNMAMVNVSESRIYKEMMDELALLLKNNANWHCGSQLRLSSINSIREFKSIKYRLESSCPKFI